MSTPQVTSSYPEWNGGTESFLVDYRTAIENALSVGDERGYRQLNDLWIDLFENRLRAMIPNRLRTYLEGRAVWKRAGSRPVFKIGGEPSFAFSADVLMDGSVELIAIGTCYRYPGGSADHWWTGALEARARAL